MAQTLSFLTSATLAVVGMSALACASVPVPQSRLTSSESSIRAAAELGASKEPRAALHLKFAQEQLAYAKQLIKKGENAHADVVLQKALADSELALAMTKETAAAAKAADVQKEVLTLTNDG